ncbi:MAG: adenylate/guanylate cyclase domain-containing protein [Thermoleophilaceae bacterium]
MTCSACGAANRPGRRFCSQCGATLELLCPACGAQNEPGDRFCGSCGGALATAQQPAGPGAPGAIAERRLVSILFADLVGFTALSEHRDPEEVRALLSHYFDRCRVVIERHGGTVEKFIGDAVMAVWGSPVAREDDAERAVRAALALNQAVNALAEEMRMPELRVRSGVLTGSAAVELGAEGEGMVLGDTVNTASRLQSLAEPGTVLVDDVTRRASEAAIAYEDAGTHQVKGRDQPVRAYTALRVVAGTGGARRSAGLEAPFVGRESELELIVAAADESVSRGRSQLVSVIGEAGMGKSRLLWEFFKHVDGLSEERYWHQGRCLSYGEGVAYWALVEMIRARAGILEEEEPAEALEKLVATVERFVPDERERRLVQPRLAHLLGLERRTATDPADLFSGWRLFFERMAATHPVILVFEDLQWADSGLLDFVDYLLEWSADLPIFILALGRTELAARRPAWTVAGAVTDAIRLGPLPEERIDELLGGLVPGLPAEVRARIGERSEGVPLYAVETVRMLLDRGLLAQDGARYLVTAPVEDLDVPETLQALVAARLDNLEPRERSLLQDAAVLGHSFTPGALAAVGSRPLAEVEATLEGLVEKQVLGFDDDKRSSERGQYAFLQALLRTIALGTLARRDRKARHLAAAQHLEQAWGADSTEIAEVLASHYLDAVAAEPDAADVPDIRASARQTLTNAGHRAASLALGAEARRYFEQAAEAADAPAERAELLREAGRAAGRAADWDSARGLLGSAIELFETCGQAGDAARTGSLLANVLIDENRLDDAEALLDRAQAALADVDDDEAVADVAARHARLRFNFGDYAAALEHAERALEIADAQRLVPILADALLTKSAAYIYGSRPTEAAALMAATLDLALEGDLVDQALRAYFNFADLTMGMGKLDEGEEMLERGLALARERGNRSWERALLAQSVNVLVLRGSWDTAIERTRSLVREEPDVAERQARSCLPIVFAARGDVEGLEQELGRELRTGQWRELEDLEQMNRGIALRALGRLGEGLPALLELAEAIMSASAAQPLFTAEAMDAALAGGQLEYVEHLLERMATTSYQPLSAAQISRGRARLLALRGDPRGAQEAFEQAAATLRELGTPFWLAQVLLEHGELLAELGRRDDAILLLQEARATFAELRAVPWLERADRALQPRSRASSPASGTPA